MQDQTLLIVVLGVVAIATTVQAVVLVSALLAMRRLAARFDEAERELRALRPRLERLGRVIDNVSDWTEGAAEHVPRVVAEVEGALDRVRGLAEFGARIVRPLRPLGAVFGLWKGLKTGVATYRQLRATRAVEAPVRALLP